MPAGQRLPTGAQLTSVEEAVLDRVLSYGTLELVGRITASSNATFLCTASHDGATVRCVYKPVRGERPLWDFPDGTLAGREVATRLLSQALGWSVVPPTLLRDGPFGPGMVQAWVDTVGSDLLPDVPGTVPDAVGEYEAADSVIAGPDPVDLVAVGEIPPGYLEVLSAYDSSGEEVLLVHADTPDLRRMAVLDVVANNADRKGGHVLAPARGGPLRGCDHGLTFHVEPKLRTVLWGFAGRRLRTAEREPLQQVVDGLSGGELAGQLRGLISPREVAAARRRATSLLRTGRFPAPGGSRAAIPWPAF